MRIPVALAILLLMGTACSGKNPFGGSGSQVDPNHDPGVNPTPSAPKAISNSEFVSSSQQLTQTLGGRFQLQGSISDSTDQLNLTTTPRSYNLQSNVQGQILSGGNL